MFKHWSYHEWVWAGLALLVALGRLSVPTRPLRQFGWPLSYEAIAHIVTGMLMGMWIYSVTEACCKAAPNTWSECARHAVTSPYFALWVGLLVWETACFVAGGGLR